MHNVENQMNRVPRKLAAPGTQAGDAGLHDKLVKTKAAMCSSICSDESML